MTDNSRWQTMVNDRKWGITKYGKWEIMGLPNKQWWQLMGNYQPEGIVDNSN